MAQLVARLVRNEKVGGSNPPSSTTGRHPIRMSVFCMPGRVGVVPGCWLCPWAAARPRAVRAASFARRVVSKPGQAPPPPTGTAAWPRRRPRAPQPGPAAAHGHRSLAPPPPIGTAAGPRHRPWAAQPGPMSRGAFHADAAWRASGGAEAITSSVASTRLACEVRQVLSTPIVGRLYFEFLSTVCSTGWLFRKSKAQGMMLNIVFRNMACECR